MAPRIVRPRSDSPRLPLTLGGAVACLVGGWFLGAWVFRPTRAAPEEGTTASVDGGAPMAEPPDAAVAVTTPVVMASDAAVMAVATAMVRINPGALSGCGDGEEMSIAGASCEAPPGLEPALRARLTAILGTCPSAASATSDPSKLLSLGLRVDFPRRRVVSLLGRSSTVPDKVSYVPCANNAFGALDEVWRLQAPHARYLYFFTARFSPLSNAASPPAPTPVTAPASTPAPAPAGEPAPAPAGEPAPAAATPTAPDATLPTAADMLRMRMIGTATVAWATAIVRETPRTGPISARLSQGTAVEIVDRRGSWYGIRWDRTHTGWTYGDAIGQTR